MIFRYTVSVAYGDIVIGEMTVTENTGADETGITEAELMPAQPVVREIGVEEVMDALAKGIKDFDAKPSHMIFLGLIYPVVAILAARLAFGYDILPLLFPLVAGFALVGPLAATGLYELSRRREQGLEVRWAHMFDVLKSPSIMGIATIGLILTAIFIAWLGTAQFIYDQLFDGHTPTSIAAFAHQVFMTDEGRRLMLIGTGAGWVFAMLVLATSVISIPLLLDRDVGALTAIRTSVRAMRKNPKSMTLWGIIVAASLFLGMLPAFVGLAIVVPVLGHATWHLYRKLVV